ncbi:DNA cytosine methyltransferase [Methylotuvimicrobium sp. KM2]|uniref:DNA cytosine methyltransferase n=1 Tax=Methylotuvimicrobium sp. KM2 TaxID=3133976 RepID=UPI003100B5EE
MSNQPKIIDVFAGAGGLSLGAARAGFDIAAAVENDPEAVETHIKNFPSCAHIVRDVSELTGADLLKAANISRGGLDGLIGGPPCQGFSRIGKRDTGDSRNDLFKHFFRLVEETQPVFFVAENVPGILDNGYDRIREEAFELVSRDYELLEPINVKASDYGAPTVRTRIFFIGYRKNCSRMPERTDFRPRKDIEPICVAEALKGLVLDIDPDWIDVESGWQPVSLSGRSGFFHTRISDAIPNKIGDISSIERYLGNKEVSGCMGTRHLPHVIERFESLNYGERDSVSKAVKLNPKGFCPTLRAGTGKDKGSFQAVRPIHFARPRVITPREAARLQGFPDWFVFHRTKWHSFRQIGNSVSPIAAEHLLSAIIKNIV